MKLTKLTKPTKLTPCSLVPLSLLAAACFQPPVAIPENKVEEVVPVPVEKGYPNEVDILFVIDNSNSMAKKQAELRRRFPTLIGELNKLRDSGKPAHYHIGVVTSDMGSNDYTDSACKPGGDQWGGGRMHAIGEAADSRCQPTIDGKPYLDVNQLSEESNLPTPPTGEDPLAWSFGCMAAVGVNGCGFEQHLESAYAALHRTDNEGFLRRDALLVLVIVADEDDCSAPTTSDVFSAGTFGRLNSFRCAQYGWVCGGQLLPYGESPTPYGDCRPATAAEGGKLHDLSRYVDYFSKPDGVKARPAQQVIITAIAADPTAGVDVLQGKTAVDATGFYPACTGALTDDCNYHLQKACVAPSDPDLSGEPAVRLKSFVTSFQQNLFTSICDNEYTSALQAIADVIGVNLEPGCIRGVVENPEDPDCVVEQTNFDGSILTLPHCDEGPAPCWRVVTNQACSWGNHQSMVIDRNGQPPPLGSSTEASCVTIAQPR